MHITHQSTRLTLSFPFSAATNAVIKDVPGWKFADKTWSVPLAQAATLHRLFPFATWHPSLSEVRSAAARYVCEKLNTAGLTVMLRFERSALGFVEFGKVEVALLDGVLLHKQKCPSLVQEYEPEIRTMLEDGESFTVHIYGNPEFDEPAQAEPADESFVSEADRTWWNALKGGIKAEARKEAIRASRGKVRRKRKVIA